MKKSTLLSLLTATSIVLTSAGTYAAWDKVADKTSADVTFRKPVTVAVNDSYTLTEKNAGLDINPTVSNTVTFTVSNNEAGLADTLTIVPKVTGASSNLEDFEFTIKDGDTAESKALDGTAQKGFVDKTISETNTYTVEVKAKNDSLAGKTVNIELEGTLSKAQTVVP